MNLSSRSRALLLSLLVCASFLGCASDQPVGERVSDQWIETKVKTALIADPVVSGTSVAVEVVNGRVSLSGTVKSREAARRAVEDARGIHGVTSVIDKMQVGG